MAIAPSIDVAATSSYTTATSAADGAAAVQTRSSAPVIVSSRQTSTQSASWLATSKSGERMEHMRKVREQSKSTAFQRTDHYKTNESGVEEKMVRGQFVKRGQFAKRVQFAKRGQFAKNNPVCMGPTASGGGLRYIEVAGVRP